MATTNTGFTPARPSLFAAISATWSTPVERRLRQSLTGLEGKTSALWGCRICTQANLRATGIEESTLEDSYRKAKATRGR